jgi:ankyrin repeat protein
MGRTVLLQVVLATLLLAVGCGRSPKENEQALRRAARQHDPNTGLIKALIAEGVNLDARDITGKTVLFDVAGSGNVEIAQLLVAFGANVNLPDHWQITPLHIALQRGRIEVARFLISAGAQVTVPTYDGETPLHTATKRGEFEIVRLLLNRGAKVNALTDTAESPLLWAASEGRYEIARVLIAEGADVNTQGGEHFASPLHMAAEIGHKPLVRLLLDSTVRINPTDRLGRTPAIWAMHAGHLNIAKLLAEAGAEINLHLAAYLGDAAAAKRLIEAGADVNLPDDIGYTPLHYAARGGQAEVAGLLIANGADVNAEGKYGNTPLHLATKHIEVTKVLVDHGAELDAENRSEETALQQAVSRGDKKVVDFLIDRGARIDLRTAAYIGRLDKVKEHLANGADIDLRPIQMDSAAFEELFAIYGKVPPEPNEPRGDTPLHGAVEGGHADIVEFLVAIGADLQARDNADRTPLHDAAYLGFTEIARILISHGAEVNAVSGGGETPLHAAAQCGHTSTVELLIANGADINGKDRYGRTALDCAWDRGFADVVALLGGDANDPELARKTPYTVIIRDPNALKEVLSSSEWDSAWIPTEADLEGFDQILKSYLTENTTIPTNIQVAREHVLAHLRCYSREYGGFVSDGTRFILCNLVMAELPGTPSKDRLAFVFDAWWGVTQVIFDAEKRIVIRVDCT